MGNEKRALPPAVGGSSLLTVFAVLCLTVFALLSLATVQADARLSDASVQTVAGYYKADHAAQEILACLRSGAPLPEGRTVRATHGPDHKGTLFSYTCPISGTQNLEVEVIVEEDGGYTMLRWQACPAAEWESDDSLDLWDGVLF